MNKITKNGNEYILEAEDGQIFECQRWFEKKTNAWHVKLPKGNPTGRTFIRESKFDNSNVFEFETKTEFRTGLSTGGWRARMTAQEAEKVAEAEKVIEEIKKIASERVVEKVDPNSIEGIMAEIERLQKKLNKKIG